VGFPTADLWFSSIQGTLFGFYGIQIAFGACNIYPRQARTNANDKKMTMTDYVAMDSTQQSGGSRQKSAGSQL